MSEKNYIGFTWGESDVPLSFNDFDFIPNPKRLIQFHNQIVVETLPQNVPSVFSMEKTLGALNPAGALIDEKYFR